MRRGLDRANRVLAATLIIAALASCASQKNPTGSRSEGSPGGTPASRSADPPDVRRQGGSPTTPASPGSGKSLAPSPTPSASSYPRYAPGTQEAQISAVLARDCVTRTGTQTLTVRTKPGYFLAFDTQYADGKDGHEYGGWGTAEVPPNGKYSSTWVVAPNAPLGQATVFVSVAGRDNKTAFRQPVFNVAKAC